jgi:carboxypeptidase Taq
MLSFVTGLMTRLEYLMHKDLTLLKSQLQTVSALRTAGSILSWDEATYMPPQGAAMRGQHIATLQSLAHETFTSKSMGKLLESLAKLEPSLPPDSDEACLIRVTRRDFERATKIPSKFLLEAAKHSSAIYHVWSEARPKNDFKKVQNALEKTLELSRQYAAFYPTLTHPADVFIEDSDSGMTVATVKPLFAKLREALVPIVEAISRQKITDDRAVKQFFPEAKQLEFGLAIAQDFGYDLTRGRQDKSLHPFETSFGVDDVRITTRVKTHDLTEALFSTLHEAGHAMYEQGISPALAGTPLSDGVSSGVHESQSRLWENIIGRSYGFWQHYYPKLQKTFPKQLGAVKLKTFYRAINKVVPSLIRTDADEVTYNLHVIIRFDLECALLEGKLSIKDLPEAWRARYKSDLGVEPPNDTDGVLQDVHWFSGFIGGAFQGYAIGNVMSAQFYEAALKAHPEITAEVTRGQFSTLHTWLKDNIYAHGRKFSPDDIVKRATGKALSIDPYIRYLKTKYGDLYNGITQ